MVNLSQQMGAKVARTLQVRITGLMEAAVVLVVVQEERQPPV